MWFRRDLRIGDNPALIAAIAAGENVTLKCLKWFRENTLDGYVETRILPGIDGACVGRPHS